MEANSTLTSIRSDPSAERPLWGRAFAHCFVDGGGPPSDGSVRPVQTEKGLTHYLVKSRVRTEPRSDLCPLGLTLTHPLTERREFHCGCPVLTPRPGSPSSIGIMWVLGRLEASTRPKKFLSGTLPFLGKGVLLMKLRSWHKGEQN